MSQRQSTTAFIALSSLWHSLLRVHRLEGRNFSPRSPTKTLNALVSFVMYRSTRDNQPEINEERFEIRGDAEDGCAWSQQTATLSDTATRSWHGFEFDIATQPWRSLSLVNVRGPFRQALISPTVRSIDTNAWCDFMLLDRALVESFDH